MGGMTTHSLLAENDCDADWRFMSKIVEIAESLLTPFLAENGMELYFAEYVKEGKDRVLRIVIDKDGGVSSDDCAFVSNFAAAKLDELDPIPDAYLLEVSSPGIERELRKQSHYDANIGKKVRIMLFKVYEGSKSYEGELLRRDNEHIVIKNGVSEVKIPSELVSKARLVFNFI